MITPNEREWFLPCFASKRRVLVFPLFNIFKCRSFGRNSIIRCEERACMAMQKKLYDAWMMGALFNEWINHFMLHIGKMYRISNGIYS